MLVTGRVAWFSLERKFGFVALDCGGEAFLHVSILKGAGYVTLPPGTAVEVRVSQSQGKLRVTELASVDTSTADQNAPQALRRKGRPTDASTSERVPPSAGPFRRSSD